MVEITNPNLYDDNIETDIDTIDMPLDNKWIRALSNLIGWDYTNGRALLIGVDENGNLKIDLSSNPSTTLTPNTASVTTTATTIVNANTDRVKLEIYNTGSQTVYISDDTGVTDSTGYPLVGYSSLTLENFTGAVIGITADGTADVKALEVS